MIHSYARESSPPSHAAFPWFHEQSASACSESSTSDPVAAAMAPSIVPVVADLVDALTVLTKVGRFDAPAASLVAGILSAELPVPPRTAATAFDYFTRGLGMLSKTGDEIDEAAATVMVEHAGAIEGIVCAMRSALAGERALGDGAAAQRLRLLHWQVFIAGARIIARLSAARDLLLVKCLCAVL